MSVAVVVVNYNAGEMLHRCLESLGQQTVRDFRTIVVDNASIDRSADGLEAKFPGVVVRRSKTNLGFSAANNLAASLACDVDWIALLNPDAFPAPDWLERLLAAAHDHPDFSFFGSRMRLAGTPGILDGTGDVFHVSGTAWRRDHGVPLERGAAEPGEIFGPCAAAALYSRPAFEEVGGFDERYFCYHEDVDLAFRLRLRGHRCWYAPDALVDHVSSGVTQRHSDFTTYHGQRNMVWTYVKNMPNALLWLYLPMHVAAGLAALIVCASRNQLGVVLRAKRDAVRALPAVWAQRRLIQAHRTVAAGELLRMMARGLSPLIRKVFR